MSNGKEKSASPVASNDFVKSNGLDPKVHQVMPVGPSMTRQEFADECDINSIMARYDGFLSDPMRSLRSEPMYIDFTVMPDSLMGAMDVVKQASEAFYRLPAKVRREFDNDPVAFADFAADPANLEQMREWELAPPAKPAPEAPAAAPGAAAPAAPAAGAPAAPASPGGPTHGST